MLEKVKISYLIHPLICVNICAYIHVYVYTYVFCMCMCIHVCVYPYIYIIFRKVTNDSQANINECMSKIIFTSLKKERIKLVKTNLKAIWRTDIHTHEHIHIWDSHECRKHYANRCKHWLISYRARQRSIQGYIYYASESNCLSPKCNCAYGKSHLHYYGHPFMGYNVVHLKLR